MGSIAYKVVSITFQQPGEQSPDKSKQGKKRNRSKKNSKHYQALKNIQFICVQKFPASFQTNTGIF